MLERIKNTIRAIQYGLNNSFKNTKLDEISERKENLVIVGNGPSISDSMAEIRMRQNADYMVVNLFPIKNSEFFNLKPRYLCSIDGCFFDENGNRGKDVLELKEVLRDKVDWPLILITPWGLNQNIPSPNIIEKKINSNAYKGKITTGIVNNMLKNRMCIGLMNVAIAALYSGIIMGYKKIYIYGIDMTFFKDFFVDENNHIVVYENHFYGTKKIDYTELYQEMKEKGILRVFETNAEAFLQFKRTRIFADKVGVQVINCTPGSYVDAFIRKECI